jgi:ABC-type sugar transport system ATPase subunit
MPLLSLVRIGKEFPGVIALSDVSVDCAQGEIHALIGENGAGKSTLIKVLGGVYPAGTYQGDILIDGQVRRFHGVHDSECAGIRIIHQELLLVPNMTVAENLFLGEEPLRNGAIDYSAMFKESLPEIGRAHV